MIISNFKIKPPQTNIYLNRHFIKITYKLFQPPHKFQVIKPYFSHIPGCAVALVCHVHTKARSTSKRIISVQIKVARFALVASGAFTAFLYTNT